MALRFDLRPDSANNNDLPRGVSGGRLVSSGVWFRSAGWFVGHGKSASDSLFAIPDHELRTVMQEPAGAEVLKGVMNLLHEIARCQNADANVAAVAMVYVCIDRLFAVQGGYRFVLQATLGILPASERTLWSTRDGQPVRRGGRLSLAVQAFVNAGLRPPPPAAVDVDKGSPRQPCSPPSVRRQGTAGSPSPAGTNGPYPRQTARRL